MKRIVIFVSFIFCFFHQAKAKEYVCFLMMNTEIKNTMEENDRQKDMRNKQLGNLSTEEINKQQWQKFQEVRTKINSRLQTVSFALQAMPTGAVMVRDINRVYDYQKAIYQELANAPYWIIIAYPNELKFIDDVEMDIRLVAGIILSYGAINQMEKAERQILLDYARDEIKNLVISSATTLYKIRAAKEKFEAQKNALVNWVNRDKQVIEQIIGKVKNY